MENDGCYIGIDPGSRNLGFAILKIQEEWITACNLLYFDPQKLGFIGMIDTLNDIIPNDAMAVTIERYVAYEGVFNSASEDILMLIGAMKYNFYDRQRDIEDSQFNLVRAIDWKPKICKYLVRNRNFENPSSSFDKKFSIAAAECIIGNKIASDHIADAACLAYFGYLQCSKH